MTYVKGISTFLFLFALAAVPTSVLTLCPANCNCRGDNNNIVICTGLAELPVLEGEITDLSITDGTISTIPNGYFNITSLLSVDLSNNQLTSLNMESFEFTSSIETITLTGNPIVCDENIDWLAMWMETYLLNTVGGTCTGTGATIEDYLSGKPAQVFSTSLGTSGDLRFGSGCESLTIHLHIDAPATAPLTYRVTFAAEVESTADHLQLVDDEVTIPTGATSTVIQFRVVDPGSGQDRPYSLRVIPKYFTAQFIVGRMLLVDDTTDCSSGTSQATLSPITVLALGTLSSSPQNISPPRTTLPHGRTAEPVNSPAAAADDRPKGGATPRIHAEGDAPCTSGEPTTTAAPSESPASTTHPHEKTAKPMTTPKPTKGPGIPPLVIVLICVVLALSIFAIVAALVFLVKKKQMV